MDCSTPGFLVHHQLLELVQTHVHRVGDAIQPSHPLSSPSPPAFNLSQHQRESPILYNQHSWEAPTCKKIQGKLREGEDGEGQNARGGEGAEVLSFPRPLCDHEPWGMAQDWQCLWVLRAQASKSNWSSFKSWPCQALTVWHSGQQSVSQCFSFPIPTVSTR